MYQNQLVFSGDCAINFDDLGQFKDFTEDIEAMMKNLKEVRANPQKVLIKEDLLRQILKADPEDTFHAPAFKDLIDELLNLLSERKSIINNQKLYRLIFNSLLQIMQDSFTSYQFSQQTGPKICSYIVDECRKNALKQIEKTSLLLCLSRLSKRLSYVDDLQSLVRVLVHVMDERWILLEKADEQWKGMMLGVYCEVVEFMVRNRQVRGILGKMFDGQVQEQKGFKEIQADTVLLLKLKVSMWKRNQYKVKEIKEKIENLGLGKFDVIRMRF